MYLWWSLCTLWEVRVTARTRLCDVFRALMNSLVYWSIQSFCPFRHDRVFKYYSVHNFLLSFTSEKLMSHVCPLSKTSVFILDLNLSILQHISNTEVQIKFHTTPIHVDLYKSVPKPMCCCPLSVRLFYCIMPCQSLSRLPSELATQTSKRLERNSKACVYSRQTSDHIYPIFQTLHWPLPATRRYFHTVLTNCLNIIPADVLLVSLSDQPSSGFTLQPITTDLHPTLWPGLPLSPLASTQKYKMFFCSGLSVWNTLPLF